MSNKYKRFFYYHKETDTTIWEKPTAATPTARPTTPPPSTAEPKTDNFVVPTPVESDRQVAGQTENRIPTGPKITIPTGPSAGVSNAAMAYGNRRGRVNNDGRPPSGPAAAVATTNDSSRRPRSLSQGPDAESKRFKGDNGGRRSPPGRLPNDRSTLSPQAINFVIGISLTRCSWGERDSAVYVLVSRLSCIEGGVLPFPNWLSSVSRFFSQTPLRCFYQPT